MEFSKVNQMNNESNSEPRTDDQSKLNTLLLVKITELNTELKKVTTQVTHMSTQINKSTQLSREAWLLSVSLCCAACCGVFATFFKR
jgi:hypothetical protein